MPSETVIEFVDAETLDNCAIDLYDGWFTRDGFAHHPEERTFTIEVWQTLSEEGRSRWRGPWLIVRRAPYRKFVLVFRDVSDCEISVTEEFDRTTFGAVSYSESRGEVEVDAHFAVEITLRVDRLNGGLHRTKEKGTGWFRRRSWHLLWGFIPRGLITALRLGAARRPARK